MKKQNGAGKYTDLIMKAIDEKPISSLPDIKKWITRNCDYNTSSCKNFRYINKSLKTLVDDGTLVKVKGKWRRRPQKKRPKNAMKKHTAKKKKHTTHPPYAKKGIYLPLTLVGGKRRKTRRRKTRSPQNQ